MLRSLLCCLVLFFLSFAFLSGQNHRSIDGSQNNLSNPDWGQAGTMLKRITGNGYGDGMSSPAGANRPNPRTISNTLFSQSNPMPNAMNISDYWWVFGQFIDHDITLVEDHSTEALPISVPMGDPWFDPFWTGSVQIPMMRSDYESSTGNSQTNPRMHINHITTWIDASAVYGSDTARADWLRTFSGGMLKTSSGNLLPYNTISGEGNDPIDPNAPFMAQAGPPQSTWFVAGDIRANENPGLTSLHTLFVREHNRLCAIFAQQNPNWTDEQLYQQARRWVGAFLQAITYEQWLPTLGIQLDAYSGYQSSVNPALSNIFSAAAYRLGHTMVNDQLLHLNPNGTPTSLGSVPLKFAFFQHQLIPNHGGIEPFLVGLYRQRQQDVDTRIIDDLRNFMFGPPGAGGLDLASININRGRDRGLSSYNEIRTHMGLSTMNDFTEVCSDFAMSSSLRAMYRDLDKLDPWVAMLAEDHIPGTGVGTTIHSILKYDFERLRDGDRFYYQHDPAFSIREKNNIRQTTFADIIMRNTSLNNLGNNVFRIPGLAGPEESLETFSVQLYPNPSNGNFYVQLENTQAHRIDLSLYSLAGQKIFALEQEIIPGVNRINIQLPAGLAAGLYNLKISGEGIKAHFEKVILN